MWQLAHMSDVKIGSPTFLYSKRYRGTSKRSTIVLTTGSQREKRKEKKKKKKDKDAKKKKIDLALIWFLGKNLENSWVGK